ncbi:hypothetical protein GGI43DRAFT_405641 [Trichoderma evansii]
MFVDKNGHRRHRHGHRQNGSRPSLPYHGVLRTRQGTLTAPVWIIALSSDTGPVQASSLPWPATCNGARAAGIGFPFSPLGVPALECKELPCERRKDIMGGLRDGLIGSAVRLG